MSTFLPETSGDLIAALDCPSGPGRQQLHDLVGWEVQADGQRLPVVLRRSGKARTLHPAEPYEVVPAARADDFDLAGWQASSTRALEEARAAEEATRLEAELWADLCHYYVVPETIPPQDHGTTAKRRAAAESLGRKGKARPIGKAEKLTGARNQPVAKVSTRVWVLNAKVDGFTPEPEAATVLVVGAAGLTDGSHRLVGMVDGQPAVLVRHPAQPPKVVVVCGGRWRRPGAEDPRRWVEMTREQLRRESQREPEDVRAAMLDRLAVEYAITPESDGERIVLEVLVSEGYARRVGDSYALAVEVGPQE
ncbi:MAG: hypothetical protein LCH96_05340 [Actinobacteria bacterium]|nr:hypothetical protein [Actinomycetota bacterium]